MKSLLSSQEECKESIQNLATRACWKVLEEVKKVASRPWWTLVERSLKQVFDNVKRRFRV